MIHKNIERIKLNNDKLNAKSRIKCVEFAGVNNNKKTPHIGRVIRVESSEFIMKILFKVLLLSGLSSSPRFVFFFVEDDEAGRIRTKKKRVNTEATSLRVFTK